MLFTNGGFRLDVLITPDRVPRAKMRFGNNQLFMVGERQKVGGGELKQEVRYAMLFSLQGQNLIYGCFAYA